MKMNSKNPKGLMNSNWANEVKIENRKFNLKYTYK